MPAYISGSIHHLPPCQDWQGNKYPERWGVSLTTRGIPMRVDGGEYLTRDAAKAALQQALSRRA